MNKKIIFFYNKSRDKNSFATKCSFDDVSLLFRLIGIRIIIIEQLSAKKIFNKNYDFLVLGVIDAINCFIFSIINFKKPKIYLRLRGTISDESYYRNKSKLRWFILCILEFFSLIISNKIFVVSNNHRDLICSRYGIRFYKKIYILPNFIWKKNLKNLIKSKDKNKQITFCYIGGISNWQNINLVIYLIKKLSKKFIESNYKVKIQIRTNMKNHKYFYEEFYEIIQKYYTELCFDIKEIEPNKIITSLESGAYGIILRDDSIVNRISSPFKIRDYLSAGIRIIATDTIGIINQYPLLIKRGNVYLFNFNDLKCSPKKIVEEIENWIIKINTKNFDYSIVNKIFLFDNKINEFKKFINI